MEKIECFGKDKESGRRRNNLRVQIKGRVRKVESDEDDSDSESYKKPDGKPVHVDVDKKVTDGGPALALLRNKKKNKILMLGQWAGTVIFVYACLTEDLNQWTDRLV